MRAGARVALGLLAATWGLSGVAGAGEWRATFTLEGALAPAVVEESEVATESEGASLLGFGRLRLGARVSRGRALTLEVGHELNALAGNTPSALLGLPRASTLRLDDIDPTLSSGDDHVIGHNLDRLNVTVRLGDGVLTVGRQAISHGSGRFFTPSDLFSPLNPYAAFTEYRAGVLSINSMMLRVGQTLGPMLFGLVYIYGSFDGVFFWGAGLALFTVVVGFIGGKLVR